LSASEARLLSKAASDRPDSAANWFKPAGDRFEPDGKRLDAAGDVSGMSPGISDDVGSEEMSKEPDPILEADLKLETFVISPFTNLDRAVSEVSARELVPASLDSLAALSALVFFCDPPEASADRELGPASIKSREESPATLLPPVF
jgi:hypothetical protein